MGRDHWLTDVYRVMRFLGVWWRDMDLADGFSFKRSSPQIRDR